MEGGPARETTLSARPRWSCSLSNVNLARSSLCIEQRFRESPDWKGRESTSYPALSRLPGRLQVSPLALTGDESPDLMKSRFVQTWDPLEPPRCLESRPPTK